MLNKDYVNEILNSDSNKYIKRIFRHEVKPEIEKCDFNTFFNFKNVIVPFLKDNFAEEYEVAIKHIFNENMLDISVDEKSTIEYFIGYISSMDSNNYTCEKCSKQQKCNRGFNPKSMLKIKLISLNYLLNESDYSSDNIPDKIKNIVYDITSSYSITMLKNTLRTFFIGDYIGDSLWNLKIAKLLLDMDLINFNEFYSIRKYIHSKTFSTIIDNSTIVSSVSNSINEEKLCSKIKQNTSQKKIIETDSYSDTIIDSPALTELHKMIGLNKVKEQIANLYDLLCFRKITENELTLPEVNLNCVFKGNPGTGKTRTAKLYADILHDAGFIRTNNLVCVSASDLIAEHVGGTAIKTTNVIEKSLGGVLFIDEAYQLTPHSEKDFSRECITTLVREMTEHKNDLVIIFAGYKKEMQEFIDVNPGMKSRIANFIDFEDYSIDELFEIFKLNSSNTGLKFCDKIEVELKNIFKNKSKDKHFGNARFVENLFQEIILEHSKNVMKRIRNKEINTNDESIKVLDTNDIPDVYKSNITDIFGNPNESDDLSNVI